MKSRNLGISLMVLLAITLAAAPAALADLPKSVDINISTNDGGAEWYKNPIVIGGGVVLLFLLVALASRGGSGTTIVKT